MPIYAEIAITHPITGIRRIIKRVAIAEIIILIPCGNLLRLMKYQNPSDKLANSDERLLESGSNSTRISTKPWTTKYSAKNTTNLIINDRNTKPNKVFNALIRIPNIVALL
ncbi:hypothetical protein UTI89_C1727 [Escherichia coli UTI89]|uniref:Uncharacterized protein n=1 Tax=Escherichia coli (strain UTI89 / UPEC) TaxID=364106 RepID=Q1RBQ9_ECOUT|nr:hypothetical protein UTI89_C1727 [Escherichia coli UTI89]